MDLKFSILCVWIQTMFITLHAGTEVTVNCLDQKIIEKNTLTLSCKVKCKECTTILYKWSNATGEINKTNSKDNIKSYKDYNYTIENPLVSQSGIYKFWIQTNKGDADSIFKVTIEPDTFASPTPEQMNDNDVQQNKMHTDENEKHSRSPKGAAAVLILILAVVLPITFIIAFKKSTTFRSRVTSWFSCFAQHSQSEHVEDKCAVEDDCEC